MTHEPTFVMETRKHQLAGSLVILLVSAALVMWLMPLRPITDPDAFDYLQIGMRIAGGEGLVSGRAPLGYLEWYAQHGYQTRELANVPLLERYLLPPLIEGFLLKLGTAPYTAAQMYSALGYILANLALFVLLTRVIPSPWVCFCLTLGYVITENAAGSAISGMTEPVSVFIFLANLILLLSHRRTGTLVILAGLLTALGYLNRTQALFYTIPVNLLGIWLLEARGSRKLASLTDPGLYIFATLLFLSPWFARNVLLTGLPLFSFSDGANLLYGTGIGADSNEPVSLLAILQKYPDVLFTKVLQNLGSAILSWRELLVVNKLVLIPFVVGVGFLGLRLGGFKNQVLKNVEAELAIRMPVDWAAMSRLFVLFAVGLGANWVAVSFFTQFARLYAVFWPLILLFAWCGISVLLLRILPIFSKGQGSLGVAAGLLVALLYPSLNLPITSTVLTPAAIAPETVKAVRGAREDYCYATGGKAILTDSPNLVAIEAYGCKQLAVGIDQTSDVQAIHRLIVPATILLTSKWAQGTDSGSLIRDLAANCLVRRVLEDGSVLYTKCAH